MSLRLAAAASAVVLLLACQVLLAASGLIPGEGETLVFERTYTGEHLQAHEEQIVESIRLELKRSGDGQRVLVWLSARKRDDDPGKDYLISGHVLLPADPECFAVTLNPAQIAGFVSVELRTDGAVRVRVLEFAELHPAGGESAETSPLRLTATDRENAVFKLDSVTGVGVGAGAGNADSGAGDAGLDTNR